MTHIKFQPMRVIVGCEYSGTTRDAFLARGHDAWSCDLLPDESGTHADRHIQGDVLEVLKEPWDLGIFHPPCTQLTSAGRWYWKQYPEKTQEAVDFFMRFVNARHIKKRAIENPAGIMTRLFRPPNQVIDPYFFGEPERKRTCLWLFGLPRLNGLVEVARDKKVAAPPPAFIDKNGKKRYFVDKVSNSKLGNGHARSKSFTSIAAAMAAQWG